MAAEDPRMALPAIELRAVDRTNADADAFVERIKALASRQERPQ
jgi:hypothetical protein